MPIEIGGHVGKIGILVAGHIGEEGNRRLSKGDAGNSLLQLLGGFLHELGMEGGGDS